MTKDNPKTMQKHFINKNFPKNVIKKITIVLAVSIIVIYANGLAWAATDLERVELSSIKLVNAFGKPVSELVNVNQQVQISSVITNNQQKAQNFVYIVQIKDENDVVVSLKWISGMINPSQSLSPALSWSSKTSGVFTVEIFVWEDLLKHNALTKYAVLTITAS